MAATFLWRTRRASLISDLKRWAMAGSRAKSGRSTLMAAISSRVWSRARKTMPIPPWPRDRTISYRPAKTVPGERSTETTIEAVGDTWVEAESSAPHRRHVRADASFSAWHVGQVMGARSGRHDDGARLAGRIQQAGRRRRGHAGW